MPQSAAQRRGVEHFVLADVVDGDAVGDQLPAILVAADEEALRPALVAEPGERGQHVVGLVTRPRDDGDRQRVEHLFDLGNLADELLRHFAAVGFVAVVDLVAKRRAGRIEGADDRVGLLLLDELQDVADEAVDGVDVLAARAGHVGQGVKDLKNERMGVDHVDLPALDRGLARGWATGRGQAGRIGRGGRFGSLVGGLVAPAGERSLVVVDWHRGLCVRESRGGGTLGNRARGGRSLSYPFR